VQRNERIFLTIEDYEVIDEKWLRNKESELAGSFRYMDENLHILSFQRLETKETPTLKTFWFIYNGDKGFDPLQISAYTKEEALATIEDNPSTPLT
jgi:hypothetical protein